jgi:hypothetical protein
MIRLPPSGNKWSFTSNSIRQWGIPTQKFASGGFTDNPPTLPLVFGRFVETNV